MTDTRDLFAVTLNPSNRVLHITVHHDVKLGSLRLVITDGNPRHATVLVTPLDPILRSHAEEYVSPDIPDVSAVGIPYGWASTD